MVGVNVVDVGVGVVIFVATTIRCVVDAGVVGVCGGVIERCVGIALSCIVMLFTLFIVVLLVVLLRFA